jgi:Fe2+ transport system protein B
METVPDTFKYCLVTGVKKGWSGFLWMLKILVPISFFTVLLDYSGWMNRLDFLLEPVMNLLSLPPMAALPLIAGLLTGIYGGIAAMVVLPLTHDQMTLIAIFLLISHSLVQEGIIQGKSGIHPLKTTLFRLGASVVTVAVAARFLNPDSTTVVLENTALSSSRPFMIMLKKWCLSTGYLGIKIFIIIMVIMVLLETMKRFNLIDRIVNILTPLLKIMGLNRKVGMLWLTASFFGITYGGAVIVEETKEGCYTREEIERLHLSIGINHAVFEDPALFLSLGLSPFWLWIPRFITAIIAVHFYKLMRKIKVLDKKSTALYVPKN